MFKYAVIVAVTLYAAMAAPAQDIQGIENCNAEKAIERRVGCMQSNIAYLHQLIVKRTADYQQKIDAANSEIAALKATVTKLRTGLDDLQTAVKKAAEPKAK